ncbi:MAG: biotin--[acetyl-CoA-carboxylase] ligase [Eubacteriales bacterium]|nr:biotin--[acetyl-CoA-carboxylase] ligase [Eubacteriales bacterium]MDD4421558.1 biotin--[acetyl-CoA-carboxylase] ligase [Eubacteriales bacterium]HBR32513.1 biotin--[acetyl-CoA-carboxylase] ligase [Clostridiales bacterium]
MNKDRILSMLEENKGIYLSGQELAKRLFVTRSAVWKAINMLRRDGYIIKAVKNKGYMLPHDSDIVSEQSIRPFLRGNAADFRFEIKKTLPSTNTYLKGLAANGEKEGLVIMANEQTAGRGRMGRSFFSPADDGIYMSVLLRPPLKADSAALLTTMAAVSVSRAIENTVGIPIGIKWVNDLYYKDKKIAGILTEGGIDIESGTLQYAIIGIGVNVFTEEFPDDLKDTAASISKSADEKGVSRPLLAAEILNLLEENLPALDKKNHISEYRARSILTGKEIFVSRGDKKIPAVALDIDENACLVVKYDDGKIESLSSSDVSIRRNK